MLLQSTKDGQCHDCGKDLQIKEDEVKDGKLLKYKKGDKEILIFKCDECYKKDKALRNFQETEVYSRIVGYLRPISQWNDGKQQEYKEREVFRAEDGARS